MSEIQEHVMRLSQNIDPHPAGTEEEQQAALYLAEEIEKETNFSASVEEFNCSPNYDMPCVIYCAVTVVMGLLTLFVPVLVIPTFILTVITAVLYILDILGIFSFARFLRAGISQNVVAQYKPASVDSADQAFVANRRRKIVLVARYDSGKVYRELSGPFFSMLPTIHWIELVAMVLVPILLLLRLATGAAGAFLVIINILIVVCAIFALLPIVKFLIHFGAAYNEGANCNAAGVSVLLEVASRIGQGRLQESVPYSNEPDEVVIHGEAEARAGGFVPENAEIVYEATPNESQSGLESNSADDSPEARLAAAKAAIAALSGKQVSGIADTDFSDSYANEPVVDNDSYREDIQREQEQEAVDGMPQIVSEKRQPQTQGWENDVSERDENRSDGFLGFEEPKPAESFAADTAVASAPDFDEVSDAAEFGNGSENEKNLSTGISEADIREAAAIADEGDLAFDVETARPETNIYDNGAADEKIPSWYKSAQEKAHKDSVVDTNKPAQRSRYADALDAAVRESNTYFQQANDAISSETESRLQHMRDSIMEVKPPSFDDIDQELAEAEDSAKTEFVADAAGTAGDAASTVNEAAYTAGDAANMVNDAAGIAGDAANITEITGVANIEASPDSLKADVDTHIDVDTAIAPETENPKDTRRGLFGKRSSEKAFSRVSQKGGKASPTRRVANFVRGEVPEDLTHEVTQEVPQEQEPLQERESVQEQESVQERESVQEQEPVQERESVQEREPVQEQEFVQEREPVRDFEQEALPEQEPLQEREQERPIPSEDLFAADSAIEQDAEQKTARTTHRDADTATASQASSLTGLDKTISFIPVAIDEEQLRKEILEQSNRTDESKNAIGDLSDTASVDASTAAELQQTKSVTDQTPSQTKDNDIATTPETRGVAESSLPSVKVTKETTQPASQKTRETSVSRSFVVPKVISQSSVAGADETNKTSSRKRRDIELPGLTGSLGKTTPSEDDLKQAAPLGDDALLSHSRSQKLKELTFDDGSSKDTTAARRAALKTSLPTLTGSITFEEKQTTTTDSAEIAEDESTSEVSQAGSFATGMFDPVGGELIEDVAPEEVYVEDADDSDYEEQFSETGAYTGAGYVEMPKSRASRFFGRFRRSGKDKETATPQQWLDVDDDFEAREVGKARGGWESFRDNEFDEIAPEDQDIAEHEVDETDVSYETDFDEVSADFVDTDDNETISYGTDDREDYDDDVDNFDTETTYRPRSWDGGGFSRTSFDEMMEASQREASSQQESDSENLKQDESAQDIVQDETQDAAQNMAQGKTQVIGEINRETAREQNTSRRSSRDAGEKKTRSTGRKKKRDKANANEQRAARERRRKPSRAEDMQRIQQFHNGAINTEVWFVALGSELADNGGMKAFIASHADELKGSIIVELEGLGAGDLSLIEKEGMYRSVSSSSRVKRYARKAAGALRINVGSESMRWKKSAAACAASHGYQVMHIAGMKDGKPAYYGEEDDVIENVSEQTMLRNTEFVLEFLKNF